MWLISLIVLCGLAHGAVVKPTAEASTAAGQSTPTVVNSPYIVSSLRSTRTPEGPQPSEAIGTTVEPKETPTGTYSAQPTTTNAEALRNWVKFNEISRRAWNTSYYDKSQTWDIKHQAEERKPNDAAVSKRHAFGDWQASGFSSSDWGYFQLQTHTPCNVDYGHDLIVGHITKMVTDFDPGTSPMLFKWWVNETSRVETHATPMQGRCFIYDGMYMGQCTNRVWITNTASWETMSSSNDNVGWTTNNSTYHGHTVRTIYDCLLDRVAVQYSTVVTALGTSPIQYKINGMKYYRYYDNNNFAWFVGCPSSWPGAWKRSRNPRNTKRQLRGWNGNPIWDFSTWSQKDARSDMTPFPSSLIPNFDITTSYQAMYWPEDENQIIEVDGHTCQVMALSRPGLRHWTARLIEIPPQTYPSINDEVMYPAAWVGYNKFRRDWTNPSTTYSWT